MTPIAFAYRADGTLRPIYSDAMARCIERRYPDRFAGWFIPGLSSASLCNVA